MDIFSHNLPGLNPDDIKLETAKNEVILSARMLSKATYNTDSLVNCDLVKIILKTMYETFSDTVDGPDADAETEPAAAHVATALYERGG